MSLQTWKEEFYKVEAEEVSKEDALDHSILKWEGLRKKNLDKHKLFKEGYSLVEVDDPENMFFVSAWTCALCEHYINVQETCPDCPIVGATGDTCHEAYSYFLQHSKPIKMINLLRKTKEFVEEQ